MDYLSINSFIITALSDEDLLVFASLCSFVLQILKKNILKVILILLNFKRAKLAFSIFVDKSFQV